MFAIKKDGSGFRSITAENEVLGDENFSATRPDWSPTKSPDVDGFVQAVKIGLGGILAINNMPGASLVFAAMQAQQWADVQVLVVDAKDKSILTLGQYDAIKSAAALFNIPIVL